jgi:hypothetical protein
MQSRNRIPTIFNIYMLDVICCALGCVILLWQIKYNEAEQQTAAAQKAQDDLKKAGAEVYSVSAEVEALRKALEESQKKSTLLSTQLEDTAKERDEVSRLVALSRKEYDSLRQAWMLSEALLKNLRTDLEKLKDQQKLAALELADKVKANAELLLQVEAAEKKADEQKKQVAARKLDAQEAAKRLEAQLAKLQAVELRNKELEKQAVDLRAEGKEATAKLTVSELRVKMLEQELDRNKKDLSASGQQSQDLVRSNEALNKKLLASAKEIGEAKMAIALLEGEKAGLLARAREAQAEVEQRFAGIALTGKRVLFLVDMSGSMAMADEKTDDPDKWPLVCETVVQLMRSIKGLQHYQVLLFSDKVRYPLTPAGQWIAYDPETTPKKVLATLKAVKPDGETNMHAVFAEAFRYREAGLDTIYVLSDGLPNAGDGLPAAGKLTEAQQTDLLTKHLRFKLKNDWNRPIAGQKRVRINAIGFFFESPDVGAFLWALAREHDGSFVGMSK